MSDTSNTNNIILETQTDTQPNPQQNAQESNMSALDNSSSSSNADKIVAFEKWDDDVFDINPKVLRGIYSHGFEEPSPIQKKAIIPMTKGYDIIGQAQSGTGKTGAFVIGALNAVDPKINAPQVLIMSPVRELTQQIKGVLDSIGHFCKYRTHLMIGGTSVDGDKDILSNEETVPHVIVGCPGRIHDMLRREYLKTDHFKTIVFDEADEMLSSCFKEQVYHILQFMPNTVQLALFSATMPDEVKQLTKKFMRNPIEIFVSADMLTLEGIKQYYVAMNDDQQKYEVLKDIFNNVVFSQTIIYCNSVKRVQDLTEAMKMDNFPVICIHSSMTQEERTDAINGFRSGKHRVLISSDLTARGIDVQQVSVVINFDVSKNKEKYLHRIGRSGRWGRKGFAINFVTRRDTAILKEIEQFYETQISELPANYAELMRL
jgi:translation initiation factor 4A